MEVASLEPPQQQRGDTSALTVHDTHGYPSDEDEHVRNLEETGQMQQVIGSQSILSQELCYASSQQSQGFSQEMGGLSQASVQTDFDSQQMVHHYGLLSQDPAARASRTTNGIESSQESRSSRASSHGGFGTLLDAVSIFQSQEEEEERKKALEDEAISNSENGGLDILDEAAAIAARKEQRTRASTRSSSRVKNKGKRSRSPSPSSNLPRKSTSSSKSSNTTNDSKKPGLPLTTKSNSDNIIRSNSSNSDNDGSNANRKRKRKDDSEQVRQQQLAKRAADLAQRTINDPELAKRLLLSMALTRENPRSAPETLPGPGHVLPEGFFWAHYPPLEKVLKDNMAEYYELSITKCQSAQQQSFNNELVDLVRAESNRQGWLYAPCFTDKNLRDRIRCYYKTHIQNAKKRLRTMVKNPTKRANARHLCNHLDLIEKNVEKNAQTPCIDPETSAVITHQDWGSAFAGQIKDAAQAIVSAQEKAANFEARVAASVAVATKTINDEVAGKRTKPSMIDIAPRPDDVSSAKDSSRPMPKLSDVPVLTASMLTVPSSTPAPTMAALAEASAAASPIVSVIPGRAPTEETVPTKAAAEVDASKESPSKGNPIVAEAVAMTEASMAAAEKSEAAKSSTDSEVLTVQTPTPASTDHVAPAPVSESTSPTKDTENACDDHPPFASPAKSTASDGEVLFV